MNLRELQIAVAPGIDRAGPVAVLIHETDVLQDVPLLVVGFEDQLVLIHLADLTFGGRATQVALATPKLVPAEVGLHGAVAHVAGLALKEVVLLFWPPGEAVSGFPFDRFTEAFHPQHHVDPQRLLIGKEIETPGPPQPQIAGEPAAHAAIKLNSAAWNRAGGGGHNGRDPGRGQHLGQLLALVSPRRLERRGHGAADAGWGHFLHSKHGGQVLKIP